MMIKYFDNLNGPRLGYTSANIINKDGLYFKDFENDGILYPYEDWRKSPEERAIDLVNRLSIEEIAGLMQNTPHQSIPGKTDVYWGPSTYNGKDFKDSKQENSAISDQQKKWIKDEHIRHFIIGSVSSKKDAAKWANNVQELCESLPHGIPCNNCTDPRNGTVVTFEYDYGANGDISHWPEPLGLAAAFDPELVKKFGEIASKEYRALGLATALSPQIDLASEPRWMRFSGTFGESSDLAKDLAKAYCDGFQTNTKEQPWGENSVIAMCKHWPGGGADESGRDAHYAFGKYSVFPGNNFEEHQKSFVEGAFKLEGGTSKAAAVMPYYTITYNIDNINHENVGCNFSKYLITNLLREKYHYDGLVCTDWAITRDPAPIESFMGGKCWGVETLSEVERIYKIYSAGVDQIGGLANTNAVLEAFEMGVKEYGETYMIEKFKDSARRILTNTFRVGLFENPYIEEEKTEKTVGCPEFMEEGYKAQLKSIIMLKNKNNVLPLKKKTNVYVPLQYQPNTHDWMGLLVEPKERYKLPFKKEIIERYFNLVDNPEIADAAIVSIRMPGGDFDVVNGYSVKDRDNGGNGYMPISLQYRPYTALNARETSIAGGDIHETFTNRSYKNKTVTSINEKDVDTIIETKKIMKNKPVIVLANMSGPVIVNEYEKYADAILSSTGDLVQALFATIAGESEPSGLLPMQLPKDMDTVEKQLEDIPLDMECHIDSEGHEYNFGFGMNFSGIIKDERTKKYKK